MTGGVDQYDAVLRAMEEGLLIGLNNARGVQSTPLDEAEVVYSYDDKTEVMAKRGHEDHIWIKRDRNDDLVYVEEDGDHSRYVDDVVSIEIVGIGRTDSERGMLEAARSAGAHDEFIAFVAEYPDSPTAESLETAISLDALDEFENFGSSFEASLWRDGAKAANNADTENGPRIRRLFPEDRWPEWMQQKFGESASTEVENGGDGE